MTVVPEKVRQAYGTFSSGWRLEKLKFFVEVRNSNVDKTIEENEDAVRLCNYIDVYYNDRITPDLNFMEGSATKAEIEKFQLKRGQVIITKDSESWDDIGIPALVTEDMAGVLCGYHLSVFEPGPELEGGFLAWHCRSDSLNDQFKLAANGVTRFGLGQYPLKNAFIAVPPKDIQRGITAFLDEKTARVDGLIQKKRRLLELLAEKRQTLVTHAVTRGLDPSAPTKPSGIDWLGDIPAHWGVFPLKRLLSSATYGVSASLSSEGEVAVLRMGDIIEGRVIHDEPKFVDDVPDALLLRERDVLFNRTNSLALVGKAGLYDGSYPGKLSFASYLVRLRFAEPNDPEFFNYVMNTPDVLEIARRLSLPSIGQANLNPSRYSQIVFPVPPPNEQRKLTQKLNYEVGHMIALSARIRDSIAVLEEYRSALITAAVTGKIERLR